MIKDVQINIDIKIFVHGTLKILKCYFLNVKKEIRG